MSTRANIRFQDGDDTIYLYRHSDGYPDGDVLPDLRGCVEAAKGRWSGGELGQLVSLFLGMTYRPQQRLCDYEITASIHGDENFHYFVIWNPETKAYDVGYEEERPD